MNRSLQVGLVTAGLPALSPISRFQTEKVQETRAQSRQALLDKLEKEEYAADSGGDGGNDLIHQMGRPLTAFQLEAKLKICNPSLLVEVAIADPRIAGVYVVREGKKVHICGMEAGHMPEFSVRHVEMQEIPDADVDGHWRKVPKFTGETRGWRTVLMRLLRAGLIEPSTIERVFQISKGRDNRNWQDLTT